MRIPDETLDEFIEIYKEEFGEDISRKDAGEAASHLLTLYHLLARQLPGSRTATTSPTQHDDEAHPNDFSLIGFRT